MKFKSPTMPRSIPKFEMDTIIGGRARGMTHKEIKNYIDTGRKMRGTFKGQGISTNTISRLLGATHGEQYRKSVNKAWYVYNRRVTQHASIEKIADQIKDAKEKEKFIKFARTQTERQKGRAYEMEVGYDAESDEFYAYSP